MVNLALPAVAHRKRNCRGEAALALTRLNVPIRPLVRAAPDVSRADLSILGKETQMENLNLFSHPEAPEHVTSGEAAAKPVEYPTFSDRPGAKVGRSAAQRP